MVTKHQVRAAALAANITYVVHHECGCCGDYVAYLINDDGDLYFDSSCGCSYSRPQLRDWQDAANYINMQSSEGVRLEIMRQFGMTESLDFYNTTQTEDN